MRRTRGFTLIELLVTLAIMALLAALVVPVAELALQRAREAELRTALRTLRNAIDAYKQASDDGRIALKAGGSGYPPKLAALVEGVTDAKSPKGGKLYFLRRIPRDPTNPDTYADAAATWATRSYASDPDHPRAGEDVFDVFSQSPGIGLDGSPYNAW
ncbi:hypothetical protein GCM10025771_09180 [Niveibacterium umoris]|uniref:General secretion pathway protein G n=1 Tax=Niveibacterium umoris TaxID=1193620 RepID=A0A840BLM6_9RHOO|nr:type II secretion system protein [Niveibacterium umoris]MBB4013533.1 general secretion pathway protein G [Niveibacterium umoris]